MYERIAQLDDSFLLFLLSKSCDLIVQSQCITVRYFYSIIFDLFFTSKFQLLVEGNILL